MSRALLKAQLELVQDVVPVSASDRPTAGKRKRDRGRTNKPGKKITRKQKRDGLHPLDRLRKELEVKDHTRDNIVALNKRGDAKFRSAADMQARKLAAMIKPKKQKKVRDDEDSDEDHERVDMWKVLRQMKSRGM